MAAAKEKLNSSSSTKKQYLFYAVANGFAPGIYGDWATAKKQVDHYSGATHKKFESLAEAKDFMKKSGIFKPKLINTNQKLPATNEVSPIPSPSSADTIAHIDDSEILFNLSNISSNQQSTPDPRPAKPSNSCDSCKTLLPLVKSLIDRISNLEARPCNAAERLDKFESIINTLSVSTKSIDFKLAELSSKLTHSAINSTTPTDVAQSHQTANIAVSRKPRDSHSSFLSPKQAPISKPRNTSNQNFDPTKCVVLSSTNADKEHLTSLKQDQIRHLISTNHGPMIIDIIQKYKFRSANPRLMIQLGSVKDVTKLVSSWKPTSLGGTSVRATINPMENIVGMIRGVPLDLDISDLEKAAHSTFNDSVCYRLNRDNNPTRTVKITFANKLDLTNAVSSGLLIPEHNMRFRIELPFSLTATSDHGSQS